VFCFKTRYKRDYNGYVFEVKISNGISGKIVRDQFEIDRERDRASENF